MTGVATERARAGARWSAGTPTTGANPTIYRVLSAVPPLRGASTRHGSCDMANP